MSTVEPDRSHTWFVRAATVIGDLSNPFYREERQRDVWNEAAAVALQVILWLSLLPRPRRCGSSGPTHCPTSTP